MNAWLLAALGAWLGVMSVSDLRSRQVSNWLTLPPLAGILIWQLAHGRWQPLIPLPALYLLWRLNIMGGADAKVLMALFALWPTVDFLLFFCVGYVIIALPVLLVRRSPSALLRTGRVAKAQGRKSVPLRPCSLGTLCPRSEEELAAHGTPAIPIYAAITLAYIIVTRIP